MVMCAVSGCRSNNDKRLKRNKIEGKREKLRFHRFPREEVFRKIWLERCDKHQNYKVKNAFVCSKHFSSEQYARNLQDDISSLSKNAIKLKPNALPALNLPWKDNYSLFHEQTIEIIFNEENMDAVVPESIDDDNSKLDLNHASVPGEVPSTDSSDQAVFYAVIENCPCTYEPAEGLENPSENYGLISEEDNTLLISNSFLDEFLY